jgi:hypothetical protein
VADAVIEANKLIKDLDCGVLAKNLATQSASASWARSCPSTFPHSHKQVCLGNGDL